MPKSEENKQGMTPKERYVQTLTFGHPDRIFYDFGNPRKSTMEAWYRQAMDKVPWLVEQGGYLPGFDHAVPPDVPLRSYLTMCELIKAIAEGRPVSGPDEPLAIEEDLGPIERMWAPGDPDWVATGGEGDGSA